MRILTILTWLVLGASVALQAWPNPLLVTLALLPIVACLPFLVRFTPRARAAAALLAVVYFVHGATEWMVGRGDPVPGVEVGACVTIFILAIVANVRERRSPRTTRPDQEG